LINEKQAVLQQQQYQYLIWIITVGQNSIKLDGFCDNDISAALKVMMDFVI
jgi:hypothetical protein